jgi:hypothetical protein
MNRPPRFAPLPSTVVPLLVGLALLLVEPLATALKAQEPEPPDSTVTLPEPGSELTVYLMTFGPGDAIWEPFGHNGIRIQDARAGTDITYHWGVFDFNQVDFIPRFLEGNMLYSMGGGRTAPMLDAYRELNRSIWVQELNLTPAQRLELERLIEANLLDPEYAYDYFVSNCSTVVRDYLDRVTEGALSAVANDPDETYRYHTRRLTQHNPLYWGGIDLLLGNPGSRPITRWEALFVPMELRDEVRRVEIQGADGRPVPLVASEVELFTADRDPEPAQPSRFVLFWPVLGFGLAVLLLLAAHAASAGLGVGRAGFAVLGTLWSLLAGAIGTILVLVLFTEHVWMYWNENILQFTPVSLLLVFLVPAAAIRGRSSRFSVGVAWATVALSVLGILVQAVPNLDQSNGEMIAFALPVHMALLLGLRALRPEPADTSSTP